MQRDIVIYYTKEVVVELSRNPINEVTRLDTGYVRIRFSVKLNYKSSTLSSKSMNKRKVFVKYYVMLPFKLKSNIIKENILKYKYKTRKELK